LGFADDADLQGWRVVAVTTPPLPPFNQPVTKTCTDTVEEEVVVDG
jgi:hypothetical protein